jgi:hypothetical protein
MWSGTFQKPQWVELDDNAARHGPPKRVLVSLGRRAEKSISAHRGPYPSRGERERRFLFPVLHWSPSNKEDQRKRGTGNPSLCAFQCTTIRFPSGQSFPHEHTNVSARTSDLRRLRSPKHPGRTGLEAGGSPTPPRRPDRTRGRSRRHPTRRGHIPRGGLRAGGPCGSPPGRRRSERRGLYVVLSRELRPIEKEHYRITVIFSVRTARSASSRRKYVPLGRPDASSCTARRPSRVPASRVRTRRPSTS